MKTLDTRELYERKCELEELRDAVTSAKEELEEAEETFESAEEDEADAAEKAVDDASQVVTDAEADFGDDEKAELAELEELENDIGREFMHGTEMIPESAFEDYARQLAEYSGTYERDASWPLNCIDWEQAAKELQQDYILLSYQGADYWVRA